MKGRFAGGITNSAQRIANPDSQVGSRFNYRVKTGKGADVAAPCSTWKSPPPQLTRPTGIGSKHPLTRDRDGVGWSPGGLE